MYENTNGCLTRRKFINLMLMAGAAVVLDWTRIEALAANIKNKGNYPIVVIGAGLGGLVSAAYLAKHGFPVTLLEQHSLPGGYATSFDRDRKAPWRASNYCPGLRIGSNPLYYKSTLITKRAKPQRPSIRHPRATRICRMSR